MLLPFAPTFPCPSASPPDADQYVRGKVFLVPGFPSRFSAGDTSILGRVILYRASHFDIYLIKIERSASFEGENPSRTSPFNTSNTNFILMSHFQEGFPPSAGKIEQTLVINTFLPLSKSDRSDFHWNFPFLFSFASITLYFRAFSLCIWLLHVELWLRNSYRRSCNFNHSLDRLDI